ncbi:Gfo/Idh/MocA family protein [Salinispira pacifica]
MAEREIRWGVLGSGSIANRFAHGLAAVEGSTLVAAASRTPGRAREFAERHGVASFFENYEDLVRRADIDAVYVATTHNFHHDNVRLALEHGKAVLCEKPLTVNGREAADLVDLARRKRLFLMEAMWTRYLPAIVQVRRWLADGEIGTIRQVRADFGFLREFDPKHRLFNPELAGGALLDAGIYPLAFASMVKGGAPATVQATAQIGTTGVDEQSAYLFTYKDDSIAMLSSAVNTELDCRAVIYGTEGRIEVPDRFLAATQATLRKNGQPPVTRDFPFNLEEGFSYEIAEAARCIREGELESSVMPLDESVELMRTIDRIKEQLGLSYANDRP